MAGKQDPNGFRPGDKVRVRVGPHAGARGVVRCQHGSQLIVDLPGTPTIEVSPDEVTNYSLAARRAWAVMPKRAGRPRLEIPRKKMVSMRLDVDLWQRLSQAVEVGLIPSREEAVNRWIRERLDSLPKLSMSADSHQSALKVRGNK